MFTLMINYYINVKEHISKSNITEIYANTNVGYFLKYSEYL